MERFAQLVIIFAMGFAVFAWADTLDSGEKVKYQSSETAAEQARKAFRSINAERVRCSDAGWALGFFKHISMIRDDVVADIEWCKSRRPEWFEDGFAEGRAFGGQQ